MNAFKKYDMLLEYYRQCFSQIDFFFFNSAIARDVYSKYISLSASTVLPVVHSQIKDNRQKKIFSQDCIRLGFIGSTESYKGFPILKEALLLLVKKGICNWHLSVWGGKVGIDKECSLITHRGKYNPNEIKAIYQDMDLLIVPSMWKETFSLVTLEAISYGVPVLVSANVGAQDIVREYSSFVYNGLGELMCFLKMIFTDISVLREYNQKILDKKWKYSYEDHVEALDQLYKSLL